MSPFLKDCWYVAAFAHELADKPLGRSLLGEPIVLFRGADGQPRALQDRCCHRGLPLAMGELVPEGIRCGYHGLVFDGGGVCVKVPGQDTIPLAARVASFPVVERDELVWIWLGDPAKADVAQIPRYEWHSASGWAHRGNRNEVRAEHLMVADNLMDLTHVGYVHKSTIGGQPDAHSSAEMKFSRTEDTVSVVRWLRNSLPPPTYVAAHGFTGRVDRWIEIEFRPGMITINAGAKDVDTGAYEGNRDGGFTLRSLHALTPAAEGVTHYFWTIAHEVKPDVPDLTERVYNEIVTAFAEDKAVLEAQYARLQQMPQPPLVDIKSDAPSIQARRIIAIRSRAAENK